MDAVEDAFLWHSHSFTIELDAPKIVRAKVPTHTEDGIPIRKIYVSNLPPKTTREELLQFFAQYGYVKSCWVKSADQHIKPYAFVTFIDPADAHKALEASQLKCHMRGKVLRVMPADTWHQPQSDADGNVTWSNKKPPVAEQPDNTAPPTDKVSNSQQGGTSDIEYNIMDILNPDCMSHVMSYVPIQDLVRSEAVSKRWQAMVHDYFLSLRTFRTSSWTQGNLTTAKLRHLLQRMGPTLTKLHVDAQGYGLNDRTARTIGKYCPGLERLTIDGMTTKYWNPILYSCKNLHSLSFTACDEIDDASLTSLLTLDSSIKTLHMSGIERITGAFLENIVPKIQSLTLHRCPSLQGNYVKMALLKMKQLKSLTLSKVRAWPAVSALASLTHLEELTLCNLIGSEELMPEYCNDLVDALDKMAGLKVLALAKNQHLDDKVLNRIAESCTKLRKLDLMGCSDDEDHSYSTSSLIKIATKCTDLQYLNVSYNAGLERVIPALSACTKLRTLVARGSSTLTDNALSQCLLACHQLEEVDVYGCDRITEAFVSTCVAEMERRPRRLKLYLGDTATDRSTVEDMSKHPMLTVDFTSERRNTDPLTGTVVWNLSDDSDSDFDQYNDLFSDPDFDEDNSVVSYDEYDEYDEDQWDEVMEMNPDLLEQLDIF